MQRRWGVGTQEKDKSKQVWHLYEMPVDFMILRLGVSAWNPA